MVLEDSESRLAYVFLMLHLVTWFLLVTERRKKFALPRIFGYLTLNIYLFTFFFLQCLQVSMRNASMVYVYGWFILNDYFFGYMYVMLSNYISPTGFWFFCFFPKVFLAVSCYFYYDDRACEIIQCMVISSVTCMVNGLTAEGLLLNCEQDQIVEFSLPDYYILQYLDLPYIAYQSYLGAAAIVEETRAKLFDVKGKSKVDESSDAKEKKE